MDVEARCLRSKQYKLLLVLLKYIPILISLVYVLNTFATYVGIDIPAANNIAGMSLLTWIFLYIATIVFKFCIYHRMFLYYILIVDIINIIDYYIGIPISDFQLLMLHSIITGISIFVILFLYIRINGIKIRKKIQMQ